MNHAAQTDASVTIEMGLMVGGTDVTGHERRHSLVPLIDGFASSGMRLGRSEKATGTGSAGNAPATLVKPFASQASSGLPHVAVSHYSATARRPWRQPACPQYRPTPSSCLTLSWRHPVLRHCWGRSERDSSPYPPRGPERCSCDGSRPFLLCGVIRGVIRGIIRNVICGLAH